MLKLENKDNTATVVAATATTTTIQLPFDPSRSAEL